MKNVRQRRRLLAATASLLPLAVTAQTAADSDRTTARHPGLDKAGASTHPIRISCIGDSMTFGMEEVPTGYRTYRGRLQQLLKAANHSVDFVGTRQQVPAIGGDPDVDGNPGAYIGPGGNANNLWDRLGSMLPASIQPDVIILAFGWNSVYNEPEQAAWKYRDFVIRLMSLRPRARIVVATLSPRQGETEQQSATNVRGFRAFNAMARQLAAVSPQTIWLADLATGKYEASDYWDGIHWLQPGADKAAEIIFRTLTSPRGVFASL